MNRLVKLRFTGSSGSWTCPAGVTQIIVRAENTTSLFGPTELPTTVVPNTSYTVNVTTTSVFGSLYTFAKTVNYIELEWVE